MGMVIKLAELLVKQKNNEAFELANRFKAKAEYSDSLELCRAAELFAIHGFYAKHLLDVVQSLVGSEYEGTERRLEIQYVEDLRKDILSYLVGNEGGLLGRLKYKADLWKEMRERDNVTKATVPECLLRIFLSYSSSDRPAVSTLYRQLQDEKLDIWMDEEKLLPGQDWQLEIKKAIRLTDVVIVCFSKSSVNKVGFVQEEIKLALDMADEQPEGKIFIIPLRLEECQVPDRLRRWQWINYFEPKAVQRLAFTLRALSAELRKQ